MFLSSKCFFGMGWNGASGLFLHLFQFFWVFPIFETPQAHIEFFQYLEPQKHIFAAAGMVCYQSSENQGNDPRVIAQPASSDFVCRSSDIALFDDGENYTARFDVLAVFTTSLPRALKKIFKHDSVVGIYFYRRVWQNDVTLPNAQPSWVWPWVGWRELHIYIKHCQCVTWLWVVQIYRVEDSCGLFSSIYFVYNII